MPRGGWREFDEFLPKAHQIPQKASTSKLDRHVRLQRLRCGKGGKTVTVISGLELNVEESRKILKKLKISCGTGGTVKGDTLELQGDHIDAALEALTKEGYRPKKSGG